MRKEVRMGFALVGPNVRPGGRPTDGTFETLETAHLRLALSLVGPRAPSSQEGIKGATGRRMHHKGTIDGQSSDTGIVLEGPRGNQRPAVKEDGTAKGQE